MCVCVCVCVTKITYVSSNDSDWSGQLTPLIKVSSLHEESYGPKLSTECIVKTEQTGWMTQSDLSFHSEYRCFCWYYQSKNFVIKYVVSFKTELFKNAARKCSP